jgi:hypothetical protein
LVLRLNTDWDAAGAGRSLLQLFQRWPEIKKKRKQKAARSSSSTKAD